MIEVYEFTLSIILSSLNEIKETELDNNTEVPNPSVKTKYEALKLLSLHHSWHNGQIAILKRILNQ